MRQRGTGQRALANALKNSKAKNKITIGVCVGVAKDAGPAHKMKLNLCTVTKLQAGSRSVLQECAA